MRNPKTFLSLTVVTLAFLGGCIGMLTAPQKLYPDGPELSLEDAAVIDIGWNSMGISPYGSLTEISPLFPASELGPQNMPSTWVALLPPGDYEFRLPHPREKIVWPEVKDGVETTITMAATIVIHARLEAGKHYRLRYHDNPGVNDFEIRETDGKVEGRIVSTPVTPEILQPFFGTQEFRMRSVN